jgi:predicted acyl esterase
MVAMNALRPVPSVCGPGWREEWTRRLDATEPWLLRWSEEQSGSEYWRHGSLRPVYAAVTAATMIIAGWADRYRNNTLRTFAALSAAGTPVRLVAGPWSHMPSRSPM